MSTIADTTFRITKTKLYIPIVTLSSKDKVKLVKLLEEGFKRPGYWNEYQTKIETSNQRTKSVCFRHSQKNGRGIVFRF